MKTLLSIVLLALTILGNLSCNHQKTYTERSFDSWGEDSIKSFLSDHWVRYGVFEENQILTDTIGTVYFNDTTKTVLVSPEGKFHLTSVKKVKQKSIPSIRIYFNSNKASLLEDDCYLPTFERCNLSTHCFTKCDLIVKQGKFYIETLENTKPIKVKYLNQNIIVINSKAYIRSEKWGIN